jgi:16S rRNA (cytosine967-C5)-methyltransferase
MESAQHVAAQKVLRVLGGATLTRALGARDGSADQALVQELSFGTLRFLGQLRAIVRALAHRVPHDPGIEALLWVALYQLIHTRAPVHAVVDCAVRAASHARRPAARGMVNAVLRNFLRRDRSLLAEIGRDPEARFSYQRWWIERVRVEYPDRYEQILDAGNARPPLCLRANVRRTTAEALIASFAAEGIGATPAGAAAVIVERPQSVITLPGYADGLFSVQDAAAQLAAPLLGVQSGMRVLDACAAPGGKTTHLAELASMDLTALDIDAMRMQKVSENLSRLGLQAKLVVGDAGDPSSWWDGRPFDRILADVPCTASGVIRRHPDGKWLRRETDIASFAEQQRRLLDALWALVAPGGRLLYSTCSLFRVENADQIDACVGRHGDAARVHLDSPASLRASEGQLLPVEGDAEHNHDGFFYALIAKS